MIAITGATGQLGQRVVEGLLKLMPASGIVAAVRDPAKATALRYLGVHVREADYDRPETLVAAFQGVEKVLLVSAVIPGQRLRQHMAVIDAAKKAGVKLLAYTSLLRCDTSQLTLAAEHNATEIYLKASSLDFVLLRNGWYLENHLGAVPSALAQGTLIGCSGGGRFAAATRADYAAAAVAVLTQPGHTNKTYELANDDAYSMSDFAALLSAQTGKPIVYADLPPSDYELILLGLGLPKMIVDVVIDADLKAPLGELESDSSDLSRLLGRPAMPLSVAVASALGA